MLALLNDPYVQFALACAVATAVGWVAKYLVLPAVVTALEGSLGKRVDENHAESLKRIEGIEDRQNTSEKRYDGELDDLRDAWSRRWEP